MSGWLICAVIMLGCLLVMLIFCLFRAGGSDEVVQMRCNCRICETARQYDHWKRRQVKWSWLKKLMGVK